MITTLSDLRVEKQRGWWRPASVADLVAALIAEGGEIREVGSDDFRRLNPGRYLVFPIPVESAEAKETPR